MTTFDEARAARIAAAQATPQEWRDLVADMWDELKAFDDAVESKAIRYVKTPAGARKYGEPVGSPIRPNGPKLDYTRRGPKRKGGGAAAPSSGSSSFRSVDVSSPEATKKVTELTPGERGREKARLQEAVKKGAGDYEKQRLRDIERHENELDATVRKAGERVTPKPAASTRRGSDPDSSREQAFAPGVDPNKVDPKKLTENSIRSQLNELSRKKRTTEEEARSRALIAEMGRRGFPTKDPDSSREAATPPKAKPDPKTQPVRDLTDAQVRRQLSNAARDAVGYNGTREEVARARELGEEFRRRGLAGLKPTTKPSDLSDEALDAALKKLNRRKRLSEADRRRDAELVAEFNRREGSRSRSQARRLVGKSDAEFDVLWNRLSVEGKTLELFGENDWDCSHMDDDDITLFLVKVLSGRPTAEKLRQADAMLAERFDRLASDDVEVKELTWEAN